jgi:hypothetical protein
MATALAAVSGVPAQDERQGRVVDHRRVLHQLEELVLHARVEPGLADGAGDLVPGLQLRVGHQDLEQGRRGAGHGALDQRLQQAAAHELVVLLGLVRLLDGFGDLDHVVGRRHQASAAQAASRLCSFLLRLEDVFHQRLEGLRVTPLAHAVGGADTRGRAGSCRGWPGRPAGAYPW